MLEELIRKSSSLGIITACDVERYTATELLIMIIKRLNKVIDITKHQQEILTGLITDGVQNVLVEIIQDLLDSGQLSDLVVEGLTHAKERTRIFNVKVDGNAKGDGETDDTKAIQDIMDIIPDGWTIYFPKGKYHVNQLIIKGHLNLTNTLIFKGDTEITNNQASGWIGGGCSEIAYIGSPNTPLFITDANVNKQPTIRMEHLVFLGTSGNSESSDYQTKRLMYNESDIAEHLRCQWAIVYAKECRFWGFLTPFGEYSEPTYTDEGDTREDLHQICLYADRCEFLSNKVGLCQLIDSEITNCRFASNERGIILKKWGFATRIVNNRIEWNNKEGIFIDKGQAIISNNEFDRNGYAGLYIVHSENSVISNNKFLRNGAHETETLVDKKNNAHLIAKHCVSCTFTGNTTRIGQQWDDGSGENRPHRGAYFDSPDQCVIVGNVFNGGQCRWTEPGNVFLVDGSFWSQISNNVAHDSHSPINHKSYQGYVDIKASTTGYLAIDAIEKPIPYSEKHFHGSTNLHYIHIYVDANGTDDDHTPTHIYVQPIMFVYVASGSKGFKLGTLTKMMGDDTDIIALKDVDFWQDAHSLGITFENKLTNPIRIYVEVR